MLCKDLIDLVEKAVASSYVNNYEVKLLKAELESVESFLLKSGRLDEFLADVYTDAKEVAKYGVKQFSLMYFKPYLTECKKLMSEYKLKANIKSFLAGAVLEPELQNKLNKAVLICGYNQYTLFEELREKI